MSETYIPKDVRRDLWIACGARCQFRGCNRPIDRNFITGENVVLGEYCHIIGDSANGPRGNEEHSKALAKDPANLILCCAACHKTIDDSKTRDNYPIVLLQEMKREHERHIQRLYDATDVVRSTPLIITGRINGTPTSIHPNEVRAAVLRKTDYKRFPSYEEIVINVTESLVLESESTDWQSAKRKIDHIVGHQLDRLTEKEMPFLDVFGLAQIPVLAYVGYKFGDRVRAVVHQAQRDQVDRWAWPAIATPERLTFNRVFPPSDQETEIAVAVSITGFVKPEDIEAACPGIPLIQLNASRYGSSVMDREENIHIFCQAWRELLAQIHTQYGRIKLHIFPAVPNSIAFEIGRSIHPKVAPEIQLWDYYKGAFSLAIRWD